MSYTQFVTAQISTLENSTAQDQLSLPDLFTKVEKSVVQVTEVDNSNESDHDWARDLSTIIMVM